MSDYNIKGISQLQGTPVSGSRVRLHNQDLDVYKGELITNSSGSFRFDLTENESISTTTTELVGLDFDGTDDRVSIPDASYQRLQTFSLECWVKRSNLSDNFYITFKRGGGGDGYWWQITANGEITWTHGGIIDYFSGYNITDTNWHHLVLVKDGGTLRFYDNGVNEWTRSVSSINHTTNPLHIAAVADSNGNITGYQPGNVSEFRFWNKALSEQEVQDNMSTTLCGTETGLVGYWRLNEIVSGEVVDLSPNSNNGTVNSSPTLVNTGEIVTECGVTGSAYNFHVLCEYEDGNGNYHTQSLPYINAVQKTPYTITFTITDNDTSSPIENAEITIASQTITTNSSGVATIDLVNETYSYEVVASGYSTINDSVTVNDSPVSVSHAMEVQATVTGGTVTTDGGYTYHTLTNGQTLTISGGSIDLEYLIVGNGNGGGAGSSTGGNGGAGGRVLTSSGTFTAGTYNVTISAISSLGSIDNDGSPQASGGTGGYAASTTTHATNGQAGPLWVDGNRYGGAGGGGGFYNHTWGKTAQPGSGGLRGGGNGSGTNGVNGQSGTNQLGGGGGGGKGSTVFSYRSSGGAGGTGIVKVRYLTP